MRVLLSTKWFSNQNVGFGSTCGSLGSTNTSKTRLKRFTTNSVSANLKVVHIGPFKLPQKWGRVGSKFGQKFQIFKNFTIPKIQ